MGVSGLDPWALAAAGAVHRDAADGVEDELAALDVGALAWLTLQSRAPRVSLAVHPDAAPAEAVGLDSDQTWAARQRSAAAIESDLARLGALGALEQLRLRGLATSLVTLARIWVQVQDSVSGALAGLDRAAYQRPDLVERLADRAHPGLPVILDSAERIGWFSEDRQDFLGLRRVGVETCPVPTSTGDLIAGDVEVEQHPGRVRVIEVQRVDGTTGWVVQISGTQHWGPTSGPSIFDLTSDLRAVNGDSTLAAVGVHLALLEAQRASGRDTSRDPVLVTGHSLGGILAASVAADPSFRHGRNVVGVVTAGSPIARIPLPTSVQVLSLEHTRDPVPRLDGRPNPVRPGWTTVAVDPDPSATGGLASRTHSGALYAGSGRAQDAHTGATTPIEPWEEVVAPVLGGGVRAVAHDFTLTREWQNPRS